MKGFVRGRWNAGIIPPHTCMAICSNLKAERIRPVWNPLPTFIWVHIFTALIVGLLAADLIGDLTGSKESAKELARPFWVDFRVKTDLLKMY